LVARAIDGDDAAAEQLFQRHRSRLRSMVAMRLDRRLASRVDPSDLIQDIFVEAHRRLPEYAARGVIPFYPWLRRIGFDRLVDIHRKHLSAQNRSVLREEPSAHWSDDSSIELAGRLASRGSSVSRKVIRRELQSRVREALGQMRPRDRTVLELIFLEGMSLDEAAATLEITIESLRSRQRRALERLSHLLADI